MSATPAPPLEHPADLRRRAARLRDLAERLDDLADARDPVPGARPPGLESLSPQELRVARLAARGLSNSAIAAELWLSPRTVSSHLYRIFPKLAISSRVELVALLLRAG